ITPVIDLGELPYTLAVRRYAAVIDELDAAIFADQHILLLQVAERPARLMQRGELAEQMEADEREPVRAFLMYIFVQGAAAHVTHDIEGVILAVRMGEVIDADEERLRLAPAERQIAQHVNLRLQVDRIIADLHGEQPAIMLHEIDLA